MYLQRSKLGLFGAALAVLPLTSVFEAQAQCHFAQTQKLVASDASGLAEFGRSVSIHGDVAVAGAPMGTGKAYVYRFDGASWVQEAILTASDSFGGDQFGTSVATNGSVIAVGSPIKDSVAGDNTGVVYVYRYNGTTWVEESRLTALDAEGGDFLGQSVAISENTILAGAFEGSPLVKPGSAYVFQYSGISWTEQAKLVPSDGQAFDTFGWQVAIHGDVAVVGAPRDDHDNASNGGSVYVFRRMAAVWVEEAKLVPADVASFDGFGEDVDIQGLVIVVGAVTDDDAGNDTGSVFVFRRIGGTWIQEARLNASGAAPSERLGESVSIHGNQILAGTGEDEAGLNRGAAYTFRRRGGNWVQECKLLSSDGAPGDLFGFGVSLAGGALVVGAPRNDGVAGPNQGAAYIFDR